MKLNILKVDEVDLPSGTVMCEIVEDTNWESNSLKTLKDVFGKDMQFIKTGNISTVFNKNSKGEKIFSLIATKCISSLNLQDVTKALKGLVWMCEDLDIYSIAFEGIEQLKIDKSVLGGTIQEAFKGLDIEVYM